MDVIVSYATWNFKHIVKIKTIRGIGVITIKYMHKIREHNYKIKKDMTTDENLHYYNTPKLTHKD
jgi:hypothetical protein